LPIRTYGQALRLIEFTSNPSFSESGTIKNYLNKFGDQIKPGPFKMNEHQVKAHWDEEANLWWSESDDVPGLCVEALTFEELENRLSDLIPELLILNNIVEASDNKPIRFCVLAEKCSTVTMRSA
jgi:hypothetical protein